ncbi:hypothetical protein EVAR_27165_1 [Eumeta japonica]|uniref:Uncharacterized protein n=1 Tax=Eumeta variegata TaxID=151549 RepID=A0A4C1VXK4_EUMVA|nr:hypothetical protein EVAR_27165_1 [Eumeta japonica]
MGKVTEVLAKRTIAEVTRFEPVEIHGTRVVAFKDNEEKTKPSFHYCIALRRFSELEATRSRARGVFVASVFGCRGDCTSSVTSVEVNGLRDEAVHSLASLELPTPTPTRRRSAISFSMRFTEMLRTHVGRRQ